MPRWYKGVALKDLAAEVSTTWPTLACLFIARGWHKVKAKHDAARKGKKAKAKKPAAGRKDAVVLQKTRVVANSTPSVLPMKCICLSGRVRLACWPA
jgi:hypothetical protein